MNNFFNELFSDEPELPISPAEQGLVYKSIDPSADELREIEKAFTRLFSTEDGQKVLSHLQTITFQRALGPTTADEHLRYIEGQRSLMATILRLIDRGRKSR